MDRLDALEAKLAAHEGALLTLVGLVVLMNPKAREAIPRMLMAHAASLRERSDELGALATDELADQLVRTLPALPSARREDGTGDE